MDIHDKFNCDYLVVGGSYNWMFQVAGAYLTLTTQTAVMTLFVHTQISNTCEIFHRLRPAHAYVSDEINRRRASRGTSR